MIIGITATALTFVCLIIAIVSYYIHYRYHTEESLHLARYAFYFSAGLIFFQSALLMWGLQTHQFQWQYVFSYSSRDLSPYYLTTTFWGGQEGTFLLWLTLGSIYGILLIRKKFEDEAIIMSFMILVLAFITMILVKKNPFTYIWDLNPGRFQAGVVPVDGNGLNPLLQDPWMIIHPPILFTGYSSTMFLFAFAMTALVTKKYDKWIRDVFPFGVFVVLALGTGIILGGYWAYTTLGWGGYWGWDPVENSSFIPWVGSLAFLHGMIIQRRHGGLKRTNIFLALLTFVLVLYGSFLTRSGILSDFSVHSFSESVLTDYLTGFVIFFVALSIIVYLYGTRHVKANRVSEKFFTRETFMLFGMLALLLSSIFTFFGTSAPLLTGIFSDKPSNVSTDYYNLLNAPVAILIGLFIALSPMLSWRRENRSGLLKYRYHLAATLVAGIIGFILGLRDPIPLLIFTLFAFAITVNAEIVIRMIRARSFDFGGYMSHVGIGLMLIGIITSSAYDTSTRTTLPLNSPKQVMDYQMNYLGFRKGSDGKDEAVIRVAGSGSNPWDATPKFYWSEFNQAFMRNPSVHNLWVKDLYISPIQVIPAEQEAGMSTVTLKKSETVPFEHSKMAFDGYEMADHNQAAGTVEVYAVIRVIQNGTTHTLKPGIKVSGQEKQVIPAYLPDTDRMVRIQNIDIDQGTIILAVSQGGSVETQTAEMLAVEVTEKPLINILWLGTIVMICGVATSLINRSRLKPF
jgi:cytochrome c-type biogenesis protein CcmF